MEQPEEILFTWDSGFGNNQLGVSEDVLGTDGTISKGQQIRYTPQKVNRPDGEELVGQTRSTAATRTCRISSIASAPASQTNCPFDVGFRVSIACRMAVESYRQGRTIRWDPSQGRNRLTSDMDFDYTPEQIHLRKRPRIRRSRNRPARYGVGRRPDLPSRGHQESWASSAIMGAIFPEELGGAGLGYIDYAIIIEELSRVDPLGRHHRRRPHFALHQPHLPSRQRRTEAAVHSQARHRRVDRLLVSHRTRSRIGRRRHAHHSAVKDGDTGS